MGQQRSQRSRGCRKARVNERFNLCGATRKLSSEPPNKIDKVRNKTGKLLINEVEVRQRWKEHFEEVLKRPNPGQVADVDSNIDMIDEMPSGPLTKAEIKGCRYHSQYERTQSTWRD